MRMKRIVAGTIFAAGLTIAGWAWAHHNTDPQYQTSHVERGEIRSMVSATGSCSAVVTVQVGSQVSGNVKALYADFNSKVHKGDLVALIDPEPFQARLSQAQAARDNAAAAVNTAKANTVKIQADIASARAQKANFEAAVARSRVAEVDAKTKLDRRKAMVSSLIISREDLDTAEATYNTAVAARQAAAAEVKAADAAIQSAEGQYKVSVAQVESASAQLRQAEAALKQAVLDLSHLELRRR